MTIEQFAQELRLLIAEGKTQEAIDRLLAIYNQTKGEYYDELIVVSSHFKILRDKMIAGAMDNEEASVQNNAINHSLLQLIDQLGQDKPLLRHFREPDTGTTPQLPDFKPAPRNNNRNRIIAGILGLALLAAVFFLGQRLGRPDTGPTTKVVPTQPDPADTTTTKVPPQPAPQTTQPAEPANPTTNQPQRPRPIQKLKDAAKVIQDQRSIANAVANTSFLQALELTLPAGQRGSIATATEDRFYKVRLGAGARLNIELTATSGNLDPTLELLNFQERSLQRLGARARRISTFLRAQTDGWYVIRVSGKLRTTGDFSLDLRTE